MDEPRVLWGDEQHGLRLIEIDGKARLQISRLIQYEPVTYEWYGEDRDLPGAHAIAVLDIANERDALRSALAAWDATLATKSQPAWPREGIPRTAGGGRDQALLDEARAYLRFAEKDEPPFALWSAMTERFAELASPCAPPPPARGEEPAQSAAARSDTVILRGDSYDKLWDERCADKRRIRELETDSSAQPAATRTGTIRERVNALWRSRAKADDSAVHIPLGRVEALIDVLDSMFPAHAAVPPEKR